MYENIFFILKYLYFGVLLITGSVAFFTRKLQPYYLKNIWVYVWILTFIELVIETLIHTFDYNSQFHLILYEFFGFFEYYVITTIFCYYYNDIEKDKVKLTIPIYGLLIVVNLIFFQEYLVFNYMFILRCLIFIVLSLHYFYLIYKSESTDEIRHDPIFWISVGFFIFSAGSIFIKGLGYEIQKTNRDLAYSLYVLNSILNIYLYIMFLIGLLCYRKNTEFY